VTVIKVSKITKRDIQTSDTVKFSIAKFKKKLTGLFIHHRGPVKKLIFPFVMLFFLIKVT